MDYKVNIYNDLQMSVKHLQTKKQNRHFGARIEDIEKTE